MTNRRRPGRSRERRSRRGPNPVRSRSPSAEGTVPPCRRGDGLFELWLGSCDGFRVIAANEPVGTVVRIVRDADGQPTSLIVRAGLFRRVHRQLPVAEVDAIVPETRRIHLSARVDAATRLANPRLADDAS
jgi:hypothetical protein